MGNRRSVDSPISPYHQWIAVARILQKLGVGDGRIRALQLVARPRAQRRLGTGCCASCPLSDYASPEFRRSPSVSHRWLDFA